MLTAIQDLKQMLERKLASRMVPNSTMRRLGWGLIFWLVFTSILASSLLPERLKVEAGKPSPQNIVAQKEIINRVETDRLRREKAMAVSEVLNKDPRALQEAERDIDAIFDRMSAIKKDISLAYGQKLEKRKELDPELPAEAWAAFLQADDDTEQKLRKSTKEVLGRVMNPGLKEENLEVARNQVDKEAQSLKLNLAFRALVSGLAGHFVRANLVVDEVATAQARRQAMESVQPVKIPKGLKIVGKDEMITEEHLVILQDLGVLGTEASYRTWVGAGAVSLTMMLLVVLYLYQFRREIFGHESRLVLTGLVSALTLLLSNAIQPWSGYGMPVAAGTMLLAILVDSELALVVGVVLSIMAGIITGNELRFLFVALVGGTMGVYSVGKVSQRTDLMRAGLMVGLADVAAILGISLIMGASISEEASWREPLWGITNGVFSAILAIGTLPFFESIFGLITSVKLLELSNPNQPLLRKLLVEAPGTYHHSIIVGNLAEAAAEAVGGDPLLARVGAYYHDVGKIKRPYFFIDNQLGTENPHDKLSPSLSALIVMSHVKDGVDLAREYKLPSPIVDFIREHHGTTLASYFYSRAAEDGKNGQVSEEDFRYDGPKPQSRETAIVLLADSCEAAVRAIQNPNPGRIEGTVRKMIRDRLNDGQLDQSDLTLRDLDRIAATFSRVLTGIFHPRIEYPENVLKEIERRKKRGSAHQQPAGPG